MEGVERAKDQETSPEGQAGKEGKSWQTFTFRLRSLDFRPEVTQSKLSG